MKFVVSTQEFNYLINKCLSIIPQKPTLPILSNLLIEAANGLLTITATDLKVGIRCFTEAKILEEGTTTLPARTFGSLIRELDALNIEINTNSHGVTEITANSSKFKVNGTNSAEFPSLPDVKDATKLVMPQAHLKEMLFRTAFAVSRDDHRYALMGVCMKIANGTAVFMGTDGKCLARTSVALDVDPSFSGTYIIPLKSVEEFLKVLEDDGNVTLYLMNDKIAIENESTLLVTKLLSGEYPDIQQIIPSQSDILVSLHRAELIGLLRQVSLFAETNKQSVKFAFTNGELQLYATKDVGEGDVSMPVDYHKERLEIAFNPEYVIKILQHIKGDTVTLGLTDSFNPGIIIESTEAEQIASANPLFVLMPLRIS